MRHRIRKRISLHIGPADHQTVFSPQRPVGRAGTDFAGLCECMVHAKRLECRKLKKSKKMLYELLSLSLSLIQKGRPMAALCVTGASNDSRRLPVLRFGVLPTLAERCQPSDSGSERAAIVCGCEHH